MGTRLGCVVVTVMAAAAADMQEAEALERLAQRLPNKAKQTKNGLPNTGKKINERK